MSRLRLQLEDVQKSVKYCIELLDRVQTPQPSAPPLAKDGTHGPQLDVDGVLNAIAYAHLDTSVMNVQVVNDRLVVSAKKWLDEGWDEYDAVLRKMGFKWVSMGRQSHWEAA